MQPKTPTTNPEERSQEFVPVTGGGDTTSAEALLIAAYVLMWAILMGFVLLTFRRQAEMDRRLSELEKAPTKRAPGA
jgi:CcmD family protein